MDHLRPTLCYNRVMIFAPWQLKFTAKFHLSEIILGNPNKYPNGRAANIGWGFGVRNARAVHCQPIKSRKSQKKLMSGGDSTTLFFRPQNFYLDFAGKKKKNCGREILAYQHESVRMWWNAWDSRSMRESWQLWNGTSIHTFMVVFFMTW